MKVFKRNAVIITVLLFVCVAVYLNWSYGRNEENVSADDGTAEPVGDYSADVNSTEDLAEDESKNSTDNTADSEETTGLYYSSDSAASTSGNSEYFDTVRLNRRQARDEASATLQTVSEAEGASQETIDAALEQMAVMAEWMTKESELESMITAKGFDDCVVYISEDGITVTVSAPQEGLSAASTARITDIITSETDFETSDLKIVEIK